MTARIYAACLAAYNNGKLHGAWIDVTYRTAEEIEAEIAAMLKASPEPGAEEWEVHDSEGLGSSCPSDVDVIVRRAALFVEHGDLADAVLDNHGGNIDWAEETLADGVAEYDSWQDWGWEYLESTGSQLPEHLQCHFDYAGFAERTLSHDYNVFEIDGKIYVCQLA